MVEMKLIYEGGLHTTANHGPSGAEVATDAPVDNQGKGESFSPPLFERPSNKVASSSRAQRDVWLC